MVLRGLFRKVAKYSRSAMKLAVDILDKYDISLVMKPYCQRIKTTVAYLSETRMHLTAHFRQPLRLKQAKRNRNLRKNLQHNKTFVYSILSLSFHCITFLDQSQHGASGCHGDDPFIAQQERLGAKEKDKQNRIKYFFIGFDLKTR